jgi:predicted TIM-barrel fold metal-dependent hydrolase
MRDLAKCPNVYVKLGGLNMDFTGLAHQDSSRTPKAEELAARQKDHVLTAIDLFGPDRCMFESNFPVDKLNVSYVTVWNIFKIMARDFSDHEKDLLFSVTAITAYGGSGSGTLFADYFGGNTIFN